MNYALASSSSAHTYGNVTSFITEYIKGLFPKNYFKTIHVSSTIAYKQFNVFQNSKREFLKKRKPMLIIRPRIELNDADTFLYETYLTTRISDNFRDHDFGNLQPFFEDFEKGISIRFLMNRMKILYDITIITETQMQQINQVIDFKNRVRQEKPITISTSLENYIPREIIKVLSDDVNIPIYDENKSVKPFLDYINSNVMTPVTYKIKNSSGNDEFFRFYPVNIDAMISGLSIDDGNRRGFISNVFSINFTFSAEFNSSGIYFYFTKNPNVIDEINLSIATNNNEIIPIYTVNNIFDIELPSGWDLYTSSFYSVSDNNKQDILDFKPLLSVPISKIINYHKEKGIPYETFMKISVMKDNRMMDRNLNEYEVDYENCILKTNNVNISSTYRIFIYINTLYINELIKDIYRLEEEK